MMDEQILSGYCRSVDGARIVTAEEEDGQLTADCDYPCCPYRAECEIGRALARLAHETAQD